MSKRLFDARWLWGTVLAAGLLSSSGAAGAASAGRPARILDAPGPRATTSARPTQAQGASGGQVQPTDFSTPPGGRIVFASERDGNYEIYVMEQTGGGVTRVTNSPFMEREPVWSPDGTQIAFSSDRNGNLDIYVMAAAGDSFGTPTRLTTNSADDSQPAWSPDGTKIAFVSSRNGNDDVFVMNTNGSNQVNLTSGSQFDDYEPAWAPNSQRLAFTTARDGNEEIYTMDASGAGQVNISQNANGDDRHASWGPTRIAFQSTRDGNDEIYSMNTDGTGQTRLTNNPASDQEPWLSADGTRIAFASSRDNGVSLEVYVMAANGTGQTRLTNNTEDNDFEAAIQQSAFIAPPAAASSVQFSAAAYSTSEEANSTTITVTRTGDLSGAATVDVAATGGTASDRSDFSTVQQTLRFASGESSKQITIFITNDAYAEPDETANLTLSNPVGTTLGAPNFATLTIVDNDAAPSTVNPIDMPQFFVRQHYIDFLNREPDQSGFNAWVNLLQTCPAGDTRCDRVTVSGAFFGSPEYQQKGYFVIRFYLVAFNRLPTYAEFVHDTQRLNEPEQQSGMNQMAYTNEFGQREDFRATFDPLSNTAYVDRLIANAGVPIGNRQQLIDALNAGTMTRAQVLRNIVENATYYNAAFNRGFVASEYYGYLRRAPEQAGFDAWLNYLNTHPGDYRTMVNGFVNSQEYRARFGQP